MKNQPHRTAYNARSQMLDGRTTLGNGQLEQLGHFFTASLDLTGFAQ